MKCSTHPLAIGAVPWAAAPKSASSAGGRPAEASVGGETGGVVELTAPFTGGDLVGRRGSVTEVCVRFATRYNRKDHVLLVLLSYG